MGFLQYIQMNIKRSNDIRHLAVSLCFVQKLDLFVVTNTYFVDPN